MGLLLLPLMLAAGPEVLTWTPADLDAGAAVKVTLYGKGLDRVDRAAAEGATVKLLGKGKADLPGPGERNRRAGEHRVEVEVNLPADRTAPVRLSLSVGKESVLVELPVNPRAAPALKEKDGNQAFAGAQRLKAGQWASARIEAGQDVDLFAVALPAGRRKVTVALPGTRPLLDPVLTVFDAKRRIVTQAMGQTAEFAAPAAGEFYVAVQDAHDLGGPAHAYRLRAD